MDAPRPAGVAKRFGNPPGSGVHSIISSTSTTSASATSTDSGVSQSTSNLFGSNAKGAVQYYYIFIIAVFAVFVGALWLVAIMRRRKRHLTANGRTNALSQDLNRYPNNRGWARRAFGGDVGVLTMRRDEGLDERGEAPPPYKPASQRQSVDGNRDPASDGLAIPMQTYARDGHQNPPDYQWPQEDGVGESSAATAPESSSTRPNVQSITNLEGQQQSERGVTSTGRSTTEHFSTSPQSLTGPAPEFHEG